MKIQLQLTNSQKAIIEEILNRGNNAEIKVEKNQIVIVEIKRKVKLKTLITG